MSPCDEARARRGILVDDLPAALVEHAEEPAALHVALQAGALQAVERHVEALADEGGDGAALQGLGDRERALLVDRLGAAQDGDEQHAGEEPAGAGQGHAERPEAPRAQRARLHARALVLGRPGHALARSAS